MILLRSAHAAAAAFGVLGLVPLASAAQTAPAPAEGEDTRTPPPAAAPTPTGSTAEAEADKRICRYVKLDMSSRRKTKVCRTADEWRALNNPR